MESMCQRKIKITDLRSIVTNLSLLEPLLEISSNIDFDLLKTFHDIAMKRNFHESR